MNEHSLSLPPHNADRVLPWQSAMCRLFSGNEHQFHFYLERLLSSVLPAQAIERKWNIVGSRRFDYFSLGTSLHTLFFYQMLIRMGRYRDVLELGTFIGVSTLFLAEAVGDKGSVVSVESGKEFYDLAAANVQRNGYSPRIDLFNEDAVAFIVDAAAARKRFDLVLMDAAKQSYGEMLEPALTCLRPGGLLLVDDVFMEGDALNPAPMTDKGRGVCALLDLLKELQGVTSVILPVGDGLMLVWKEARDVG